MKTTRQVACLAVALLLVCQMVLVSAETAIPVAEQDVSSLNVFFNNLFHNINIQPFSVVGDSRSCGASGGTANHDWTNIPAGSRISTVATGTYNNLPVIDLNSYSCANGNDKRIIDLFTNGWTSYGEYRSGIDIVCGNGPCNVEVYCCPKAECSSNNDCSGGTCKTISCPTSVTKGSNTFYWCPGESGIPYQFNSYSYCQQSTTMTCYYRAGTSCLSRSYDKSVFPNSCESYTYEQRQLYSSLSSCQGQLGSCSYNNECPSGKICSGGTCVSGCTPNWGCQSWSTCSGGTQTRTCTDTNNCGTTTGKPSTSQSCTAGETCGNGVCGSGESCSNCVSDCGGCSGTGTCGDQNCDSGESCSNCATDCGACTSVPSCEDNVKNQGETGVDCGGPCSDCQAENLNARIVVEDEDQDIILANPCTTEDVKQARGNCNSEGFIPTQNYNFKVTLKNVGTETGEVYIEAGFYNYDYAKNQAKLFSVVPLFAAVNPEPIANCVGNEPFVKTIKATLAPGEKKTVTISMSPINALVTLNKGDYVLKDIHLVSFLGVLAHTGENACCKKLAGFTGCSTGTGGYSSSKYDDAYVQSSLYAVQKRILCDAKVYGYINQNLNPFADTTVTIKNDYHDCIKYTFYNEDSTVNENATDEYERNPIDADNNLKYSNVYKIALKKDDIKIATNTQLLASACLMPTECVYNDSNYTVACQTIKSLREEGVLTQAKTDDFFASAKDTVNAGITGASIGGVIGLIGCGATIIAIPFSEGITAPLAISICPWAIGGGAAVGAGAGVAINNLKGMKPDDDLVKQLNAKNDNAVGICTATKNTSFDVGGILKNIGHAVKITGNETTDGIIVIVGGLFILMFLFNMMNKK